MSRNWNCHLFYEPDDQRDLEMKPVIKNGGTKIRLCGKGKHIEEITDRFIKLGFRERDTTSNER